MGIILLMSLLVVYRVEFMFDVAVFMLQLSAAELPANWRSGGGGGSTAKRALPPRSAEQSFSASWCWVRRRCNLLGSRAAAALESLGGGKRSSSWGSRRCCGCPSPC